MSYGNYTPLGINTLGSFLQGSGLSINPYMTDNAGYTTANTNYTKGTIVSDTVLNNLVDSIKLAYDLLQTTDVTQTDYDNLISIGSSSIPALGNAKPSTVASYTGAITQFGFLRLLPKQAYDEFTYGGGYGSFLRSFATCYSYINLKNTTIATLVNSLSFMDIAYSNMNDLITSDIAGVNPATLYWGQDLIRSGRVLDLAKIRTFGSPSNLLLTFQDNKAITKALSMALLTAGLTTQEILDILSGDKLATLTQEKKIYAAYGLIMGNDLKDILVPLNCRTEGLTILTDLLDLKKIFPNSYSSLTVPKYNVRTGPTNSKTYYLIYQNGGTTPQIAEYGNRLGNVLPLDIAVSCGSFSAAMQQIKNIAAIDIERFSQVVTNLETVTDLTINGSNVPTNPALVNSILASLALGSGVNGQYTMYDFFGAMVGKKYPLVSVKNYILKLQTDTLAQIYSDIKDLLSTAGPYDDLAGLIDDANTEIDSILAANATTATNLNLAWDNIGTLLTAEQNFRAVALTSSAGSTDNDIYAFILSMTVYAFDTAPYMCADLLEKISDLTTLGGQYLIGLMRETRNTNRINLMGGIMDNSIPSQLPTTTQNYLGIPLSTGEAVSGSLAGSTQINLIPPNLRLPNFNPEAISTNILTPPQAINHTTTGNCDCWDNL